jgi:hypothetical protein
MCLKIKKIATKIIEKEAIDRTRPIKLGIILDKNSSKKLEENIRQILGFNNFVGKFIPIITLNLLINSEATTDRKFKTDLSNKINKITNLRFKVL